MCPTGTTLRRGGISNLRSAFDVLDADGDGKISHEDLRAFYGGFSGADTSGEEVIESMIAVADSNKDGFVGYDEFEKVLGAKKGKDRRIGVMEDAFRVMDKDGDGKVGHDDLKILKNKMIHKMQLIWIHPNIQIVYLCSLRLNQFVGKSH